MIGDVTWDSPSPTSAGSLPLGNGDIAANVWVEPSGDLVLYLAKNDAWDHLGRLIKLGRLRLTFSPALDVSAGHFQKKLSLADASIQVTAGAITVRLWIDAHWPRCVIEVHSQTPVGIRAALDPWRTAPRTLAPREVHAAYGMEGGPLPITAMPDQIYDESGAGLIWYQRNETSVWGFSLEQQALGGFKAQSADPLLHRTFGALLAGTGFERHDERSVATHGAVTSATLTISAHTAQTVTIAQWVEDLRARAAHAPAVPDAWRDHGAWWRDFWARSHVTLQARGPDWGNADLITQQSRWQRYLLACCSRGLFPMKFNGGLFTADWQVRDENFDADYRRWGGPYWFQNTRLIYWSMLAQGDYELQHPLFRMYRDMLPLAEERTRRWFGHEGAFFPETLYFWGTYVPSNYGWDRAGKHPADVENRYIGRHWMGGLELLALMLDAHAHTGSIALLEDQLLPLARSVLRFYASHYPADEAGKLCLKPAQALETWWEAENPLPEIAGLRDLLPRLLALSTDRLAPADRQSWQELLARLPALPEVTESGKRRLAPAAKHELVPSNSENPELYGVFPFRLFGVGLPDLEVARQTFLHRMFPDTGGWRQDALMAALLGLTESAAFYLTKNWTDPQNSGFRFKGFWGPNYDWVPDLDHGSVSQLALQHMLLQCVGRKIYLFPAWPVDRWNVNFRLHAPDQTVIDAELKDGKLTRLAVSPEARRADIVVMLGQVRDSVLSA